jgi:hypothetical protein
MLRLPSSSHQTAVSTGHTLITPGPDRLPVSPPFLRSSPCQSVLCEPQSPSITRVVDLHQLFGRELDTTIKDTKVTLFIGDFFVLFLHATLVLMRCLAQQL